MNVNSVSFNGLWVLNSTKSVKNDREIAHYDYRPFADESREQAKSQVDQYNGKKVESYYNDSEYPYMTTLLDVKMGAPLNISSTEYAKTKAGAPDDFDRSGSHEKILVG